MSVILHLLKYVNIKIHNNLFQVRPTYAKLSPGDRNFLKAAAAEVSVSRAFLHRTSTLLWSALCASQPLKGLQTS